MKLSDLISSRTRAGLTPGLDDDLPDLPEDEAGHTWVSGLAGWACAACLGNTDLFRVFSRGSGEGRACRFCQIDDPAIEFASLDGLVEYLYQCLLSEFDNADTTDIYVPWDVREAFGAEPMSTLEVLAELGEEIGSIELANAIESSIDHLWVLPDGLHDRYETRILDSWEEFARSVQTGPRFLFSADKTTIAGHSLTEVLAFLATTAAQLQTEFVRELEPGTAFARARGWKDGRPYTNAEDLGSPPPSSAMPQRLSAAGVACFYAAEERETAIAEIRVTSSDGLTVGTWRTERTFRYVDLVPERRPPSIFDPVGRRLRGFMRFLGGFQRSISKPKDESIGAANSYLPTQIFGEYLRYSIPTAYGHGVDAVRYPSDANHSGVNWCFFGRPEHEEPPGMLLIETDEAPPT